MYKIAAISFVVVGCGDIKYKVLSSIVNMAAQDITIVPTLLSGPGDLVDKMKPNEEFHEGDTFINISQLHEDLEIVTDTKHILMETLYLKAAPNRTDQISFYTRNSSGRATTYDKILFGVDLNAPPGNNIVAFMIGRGQNDNFYRDCLCMRDTGELGKLPLCHKVYNIHTYI